MDLNIHELIEISIIYNITSKYHLLKKQKKFKITTVIKNILNNSLFSRFYLF